MVKFRCKHCPREERRLLNVRTFRTACGKEMNLDESEMPDAGFRGHPQDACADALMDA